MSPPDYIRAGAVSGLGRVLNRHGWVALMVALPLLAFVLAVSLWMFDDHPCMTRPDKWPYSTDWWPGEFGNELRPGDAPEDCSNRLRGED